MQEKPSWWDYQVFGYTEEGDPILIGFKKNTPKEVLDDYKKYQKEMKEAEEKGILI